MKKNILITITLLASGLFVLFIPLSYPIVIAFMSVILISCGLLYWRFQDRKSTEFRIIKETNKTLGIGNFYIECKSDFHRWTKYNYDKTISWDFESFEDAQERLSYLKRKYSNENDDIEYTVMTTGKESNYNKNTAL